MSLHVELYTDFDGAMACQAAAFQNRLVEQETIFIISPYEARRGVYLFMLFDDDKSNSVKWILAVRKGIEHTQTHKHAHE